MTPERRAELRRCEDAVARTSYELDRRKFMAAMEAQEDRIKALESLLSRSLVELQDLMEYTSEETGRTLPDVDELIAEIDAMLPATEGDKDEI